MRVQDQVAVVIPCLNEARAIRSLVQEVRQLVPTVFVVDDASTDATPSEARAGGAKVLKHQKSRGKGAALNTGFSAAAERGFKWALAMDGDGQHRADDIPRMLAAMEQSHPAMVVGNRMGNSAGMPLVRRFVNWWMSRQLSTLCGTTLPDSQCGFRVVNLSAWARLDFGAQHFEIESELIVRFLKSGARIDFVPVQTHYAGERSKIRPLRDTLRWFHWWREIRKEYRDASYAPTTQDATA